MELRKSEGFTPTEKLLSNLCEKTFLKMFSYLNPFREDGKELCDLIAVFDNHIFIFFDRESRKFDNAGKDISITWNRWKKEVVDKQIKALRGAKKYIETGKPIFIDAKCEITLPIEVRKNATIHKFIIAHGATEACKAISGNNVYGSIGISYSKPGHPLVNLPFFVELKNSDPVHILDSFNIEIVLGELDTFFDFTSFINEKENAIRKYDHLIYCGEEDLLAHYFLHYDQERNRYRIGDDDPRISGIMLEEGSWKDLVASKRYQKRKEANRISYFWDELIQKTYQNAFKGTLIGDGDLSADLGPINEMAKEPRLSRRFLSKNILSAMHDFPEIGSAMERKIRFMPSFYKDKGYVFLQLKYPQTKNYRKVRQYMLKIACGVARNKFSHLNTVIGIAIDSPKLTSEISEDFALLDCSEWTEKDRAIFERENKDLNFFETENMRVTFCDREVVIPKTV